MINAQFVGVCVSCPNVFRLHCRRLRFRVRNDFDMRRAGKKKKHTQKKHSKRDNSARTVFKLRVDVVPRVLQDSTDAQLDTASRTINHAATSKGRQHNNHRSAGLWRNPSAHDAHMHARRQRGSTRTPMAPRAAVSGDATQLVLWE